MSDGEWVRRALDGPAGGRSEAFGRLAEGWGPRLAALCHARVGNADAAEELAQEALVRGYFALRTLQDPDKFGPWLCGIAARVCFDWLKSKGRREASFSTADLPEGVAAPYRSAGSGAADDPAGLEAREERGQLLAAVERLPPKHREVVMLYYYQDCTYKDLADQLGVSAATINARLSQARAMLRRRLSGAEK